MRIGVRNNARYKQVDVEIGNTMIDLGLHNDEEAEDLAKELLNAAIDLVGEGKVKVLLGE